jgi:restriction system protein
MIEEPLPNDWRQLQTGVCRLLNEVGLSAELEKKLQTARGEVEIDVKRNKNSVDRIRYLVECKNWSAAIPQTVVHAFTTVMHETGGNVGFIVSREGLQAGGRQYLRNTNIVGLTYLELQERYLERWWAKYFAPTVGSAALSLLEYVEPINSLRERMNLELPSEKREEVRRLQKKYTLFGMVMAFFEFPRYSDRFNIPAPENISAFKTKLIEQLGDEFVFSSEYYRDLAHELSAKTRGVTDEFHEVFGRNIFS